MVDEAMNAKVKAISGLASTITLIFLLAGEPSDMVTFRVVIQYPPTVVILLPMLHPFKMHKLPEHV